jgi:hypothetical protein
MKKYAIFLLLGISTILMFSYNVEAKYDSQESNSNQIVSTIVADSICREYGICDSKDIKMKKEHIYDINLNKIGYVYDVYAKKLEVSMFVIILVKDNELKIEEYVVGQSSPYLHKELKNIYLGYGMYYELQEDLLLDSLNEKVYVYHDVSQWYGIDEEHGEIILASSIPSDEPHDEVTEVYNYYELIEDSNYIPNKFPMMSTLISYETNNGGNNCSPTAGLEILLYFDKYYSGLTPAYGYFDYTNNRFYTYDEFKSNFFGTTKWDKLTTLYVDLYDKMGTNNIFGLGTTHGNFLQGLEEYVDEKGYKVTVNDIIGDSSDFMATSNTSFDSSNTWSSYRSAIDNGKPVVIQMGALFSEYYVAIKEGNITIIPDNYIIYRWGVPYMYYDTIEYEYTVWEGLGTMHTVVGYGYLEYELYAKDSYTSNLIFLREDKFAIVAWGWSSTKYAYIASDSNSVSQVYSIDISPVIIPGC